MGRASVHLNAPQGHTLPEGLLERAVRLTLREEGHEEGEVSVTFLSDAAIRQMNERWLGHDEPTDVLAFALHEPGHAPLGDVYVGFEAAGRQATSEGVALEEELARLVIHGTLHVLGYDHPKGGSRERLRSAHFRRQEALLAQLLPAHDDDARVLRTDGEG